MEGFNEALGENIRNWRLFRRMTLARLAAKIGVSYQQLQKHERGRSALTVERLMLISHVLGCEVEQLLFGVKTKNDDAVTVLVREFGRISSPHRKTLALELIAMLGD